jgi:hypothetical protein
MKPWNFSAFSLSAFKFGVQSFDVQYLSAFGHSVLGPYSALGPIRRSVIRCSVIRCSVFRRSVSRCSVIRRSVFRRSVGESTSRHGIWNSLFQVPYIFRCVFQVSRNSATFSAGGWSYRLSNRTLPISFRSRIPQVFVSELKLL